DALLKYQNGLFILSSTASLLERLANQIPAGRLFVEVQKYPASTTAPNPKSQIQNPKLALPPVATNNVIFLDPSRYLTHRVLAAIRENILLDDVSDADAAHPEAYFKSPDQMAALFRDLPEALANTIRIADACNLELELGKPHFPHYDLPPGESPYSYLCKLAFDGACERYRPIRPEVLQRLQYELDVINKLGFPEYFLIVWDIVQFARRNGIPICGRGSAADSLVAYALGITSVDPLKFDLYFERFLNLSRSDCPDIDLDLCWRRRDEVLKYVYEKYGAERVAMIANHNTYQARSAFRDVARVFGLPLGEINSLAAALPYSSVASIRDAIRLFPETRDFPIDREPYKTIVQIAETIDGFPRHLSIHVGGIVIGDKHLTSYLPLERATKGLIITQYDMGPVEELGLVKIDLLGQRSLTVITDTIKALKGNLGIEIDLASLPDGDPKTVGLLRTGRTIGCFQIESPGMRNLLQMIQAQNIRDVIMALSLIRPGPSGSGMKGHFIRRRLGLEKPSYLAPQLRDVLKDTYGVMLYQEDILKVAEAVAGFTLTEGDELRKAISKKRSPERIRQLATKFMDGARQRGIAEKPAAELWTLITNFANYSYCKAHATTYGHIAYQAVYLKAHYPAEFLAAVLSNRSGFYEPREYVEEARRLGVRILLPDINESGPLPAAAVSTTDHRPLTTDRKERIQRSTFNEPNTEPRTPSTEHPQPRTDNPKPFTQVRDRPVLECIGLPMQPGAVASHCTPKG
ncbi:MAG: DNA polymerase III subunit alpha, partial [Planctomycetes bacterium]|nr:DNA polymerase III subunit alpha [Planctomycetota bacterium]